MESRRWKLVRKVAETVKGSVAERAQNHLGYYVDFGEDKLPEEYYSSNWYDISINDLDKKYATGVENIKFGDDLLFLYFAIKGKNYKLVYDTKKDKIIVFCELFRVGSNVLYGEAPSTFDVCGNFIYDWKTPEYFDAIFSFLSPEKVDEPYQSQLDKLREEMSSEDNPYIFKYWLKNDAE